MKTRVLAAIATILLAGACRTTISDGDRAFEAGDYARAASLYLKRSVPDEQTMFRLALAQALAPPPKGGEAAAAETFRALLQRFPESPHRVQAELYLRSWAQLDALRIRVAALEEVAGAQKNRASTLEAEARARQAELDRVRAALLEKEKALRQVQGELEQLKRIDLGSPR